MLRNSDSGPDERSNEFEIGMLKRPTTVQAMKSHHEQENLKEEDQEEVDELFNESSLNQPILRSSSSSDRSQGLCRADDYNSSSPATLWGFYTYSFASEVFAIVSITLFLPITLEQFARDNGYLYPDLKQPCPGSFKANQILKETNLHNSTTKSDVKPLLQSETICQTQIFGKWFDTASFPLYIFSVSVAIQAFIVASMGDVADDAIMRKVLLVSFAGLGSLAGFMFFFIDSDSTLWPISAPFTMIANVSLGASIVCLNSYIPSLARSSVARKMGVSIRLLEEEDQQNKIKISETTASISAKGIAVGYSSGILALCISMILITSRDGDTNSLRWTIGASAIWWALCTIPACFWLTPRNFLIKERIVNPFRPRSSFNHIWKMLREYKRLKNTIRFLLAWFLLSDAFSTITSTAILFGKTSLNMKSSHLILIGLITPLTGIIGSILAPKLQFNLRFFSNCNDGNLRMFKFIIFFSCFIPGYVSTGVLFGTKALSTELEMFILAGVFGMFYGAFQAYARSVFSELIPPGQEAKWYALYSITDKSSSFFGPFIVGLIADYSHNIRYAFLFILMILALSFPILNLIDLDQGKLNAREFVL